MAANSQTITLIIPFLLLFLWKYNILRIVSRRVIVCRGRERALTRRRHRRNSFILPQCWHTHTSHTFISLLNWMQCRRIWRFVIIVKWQLNKHYNFQSISVSLCCIVFAAIVIDRSFDRSEHTRHSVSREAVRMCVIIYFMQICQWIANMK